MMNDLVLIRGGGDLASGVAARLHRAGFKVLITELPKPLVVRRLVSFAEAVYTGMILVEEVAGRKAENIHQVGEILTAGEIAVLVDPDLKAVEFYPPAALVDARMIKRPPKDQPEGIPLLIGLGPGFTAGKDCDAVVETMRGHTLGRVIWRGQALADTGIPETVGGRDAERVLRAPADGVLCNHVQITDRVKEGDLIAEAGGLQLHAPFDGVIRGLLHEGLPVHQGMKIGDLDPRNDPAYCTLISDKSLSIGGGVLEALLSKAEIRARLLSKTT
jgi:xanthine dehydrogenase accessory factor